MGKHSHDCAVEERDRLRGRVATLEANLKMFDVLPSERVLSLERSYNALVSEALDLRHERDRLLIRLRELQDDARDSGTAPHTWSLGSETVAGRVTASGRTHELNTRPLQFAQIWLGNKTFERRVDDRNFRIGDSLELQELAQDTGCDNEYTGRSITAEVTWILHQGDYAIMSIRVLEKSSE